MTREDAIAYFKRHIDLYCVTGICREAEEMAIQALEQEPTITSTEDNAEMVYPQVEGITPTVQKEKTCDGCLFQQYPRITVCQECSRYYSDNYVKE